MTERRAAYLGTVRQPAEGARVQNTSTARQVHPGIDGLALALGGGLRLLERIPGRSPSGTLLIRGAPGTGKSVLAARVATAVARQLEGDVLYGTIELLPIELEQQLDAFSWTHSDYEFVDLAHTTQVASQERRPTALLAGLLPLAAPSEGALNLRDAIDVVAGTAYGLQYRPRVFVLDSLAAGYRLGPQTPREVIDGVCKLAAERGWLIILVEEASDTKPSSWSFAVDTVLELGWRASSAGRLGPRDQLERSLTVSKHRLGASHAGPHAFAITQAGPEVYPNLALYGSQPDVHEFCAPQNERRDDWSWNFEAAAEKNPDKATIASWPRVQDVTVAVFGDDSSTVRFVAERVGAYGYSHQPKEVGRDVWLSFETAGQLAPPSSGNYEVFRQWDPTTSAEAWMSGVLEKLGRFERETPIRRLLVGDLRALRLFRDEPGMRRAVALLARMLRRNRVPTVLFETALAQWRINERVVVGTGVPEPEIVDLADVAIEVSYPEQENAEYVSATMTSYAASRRKRRLVVYKRYL